MKGTYTLIIYVKKKTTIKIGKKLGEITFKRGIYVYVGSAMNSLESRLKRQLSDEKKLHWHVDYLLASENVQISEIYYTESARKVECELSRKIENENKILNFGCSDCKCESHLHYFKNKKEAKEVIKNAYNSLNLNYKKFRK